MRSLGVVIVKPAGNGDFACEDIFCINEVQEKKEEKGLRVIFKLLYTFLLLSVNLCTFPSTK